MRADAINLDDKHYPVIIWLVYRHHFFFCIANKIYIVEYGRMVRRGKEENE